MKKFPMRILSWLEMISPTLVARLGYRAFNHPQSRKYRAFEKAINEQAQTDTFTHKGKRIARYTWGAGDKKALLIHGWEGRASNFGKIIPVLLQKGYQVVSFDSPGHGHSERTRNPFMDFFELIQQFLTEQPYDLLMSHSAGSALALWALHEQKLRIPQVVICTTPNSLEDRFALTVKELGLKRKTMERMMAIFEKETGYNPRSLVANEMVMDIPFEEILFISDAEDRVLPIEWTRAVHEALPQSELLTLHNTGHFRMLWSEEIVEIAKRRIH